MKKILFIILFVSIPVFAGQNYIPDSTKIDSGLVVLTAGQIAVLRSQLEKQLQQIEIDRLKIQGILEFLLYIEEKKKNGK